MATDIMKKAAANVLKKEKDYPPKFSEEELKEFDDLGGMHIKREKKKK